MCTIMTVTPELYGSKLWRRIFTDAAQNADGFSLILIDWQGASTIIRTMDIKNVTQLLERADWDRMFLHCRFATQGEAVLKNTHGWSADGVYYMHNGMISDPASMHYNVDSQVIGAWLRQGVPHAMEKLLTEKYANVFLIDTNENYYTVSRSQVGTLYTDWRGNYSTNKMGPIRHRVPDGVQNCYWLVDPAQEQRATVATEGL